MARSNAALLISRAPITDTTVRVVARLDKMNDSSVQWIVWSGAGSAAVTFYGTLSKSKDLFEGTPEDPATEKRWSPIPVTFLGQPGSGPTGEILPIADVAVYGLMLEVVVTGTIELELLVYATSRGT